MNARIHEQLARQTFLTNGGTETFLMFELGYPFESGCAFTVFDDEPMWNRLVSAYLDPIADAALENGHGLMYDVMVWRASPDWFARIGQRDSDVERFNVLAVERTRDALDAWRARSGKRASALPILLNADIGPRGDGYRVDAASATPEAGLAYHERQLRVLAKAGVDLAHALTMTHANEAIGIALAAREHGLPVIVSPTVETDGRLPDGMTLGDFVRRVEDATDGYPVSYMVNCAHPTHVVPTLEAAKRERADWLGRFKGFRANASSKSHQELDESPVLDPGDPDDLASRVARMQRDLGLRVIGGCCGTDARHIRAIARATARREPAQRAAASV